MKYGALSLLLAATLLSAEAVAEAGEDPEPYVHAGYRNGLFYLRSPDDVFRLYVQGRVHADWQKPLADGLSALPPDQALKGGFFLRRARLEIGGEFFERWQWQVSGELAPSAVDNVGANTATRACTVDAKTQALVCTDREAPVEAGAVRPAPTDVFVNLAAHPLFNMQVGQFYIPFSLENRISDNTTPFLERSMAMRGIGTPNLRDLGLMAWGESPDRVFYYAAAILNGDGPNRPNADSRYDFVGRTFVRPLMKVANDTNGKWAEVGLSARWGSRDSSEVGYDMPALTTQSGFAFWRPTYRDSQNRLVHIMPASDQWAVGGDVYFPFRRFDLTSELVYARSDTREALDGFQLSSVRERSGALAGYGFYATLGYWILGDQEIVGHPSYAKPNHLDFSVPQKPARQGVEALVHVEKLHLRYLSSSRSGLVDAASPDGIIDVDALAIGANYWATRHLRVSLDYGLYLFPDSAPASSQTRDQRAIAPAQLLAKGGDEAARASSHTLHEISARVGVQF